MPPRAASGRTAARSALRSHRTLRAYHRAVQTDGGERSIRGSSAAIFSIHRRYRREQYV